MEAIRYETLQEVDERLAREVDERLAREPGAERVRWYQRSVPVGWLLVLVAFALLAVAFSIGLTLHEAYDAQTAMGETMSPPPFNNLFESIHGLLSKSPDAWMWGNANGSLFASPNAWMWGG